MESCAIIVPCYNEEHRFQTDEFEQFLDQDPTCRFVFVNDGSQDQTANVLGAFVERHPDRCQLLDLKQNVGKAEAVRQGILQALQENPTYFGYWDADLATPLEAIPLLRNRLETQPELNMVFGSRVRLLGRTIERRAIRHYAGRVFATAASLVLNLAIYDTQCGAKLFRNIPVVSEQFTDPFLTSWIFDVEIIARYGQTIPPEQLAQTIYEYPLQEWRDVAGSKVQFYDFFKAAWELRKIQRTYRRK
ncbi:MAG: glycosyltransferase [Planctomycetaceae bacterium]|nr:glycosyltransferase [Planctomycetaceae bacterium]